MKLLDDSFSVILRGDWNSFYLQPDWMAKNVFEAEEVEIGIKAEGYLTSISYRCKNVVIDPTPNRIVFQAENVEECTIHFLALCVKNFLDKATIPVSIVYGLNVNYIESDTSRFTRVIDSISDSDSIADSGYVIDSANITRRLKKDGKVINMLFKMEDSNLSVSFNEHHSELENNEQVSFDCIMAFLKDTSNLLKTMGYSFEEIEDE